MITEKTLAEHMRTPPDMPGNVFFLNDKPVIIINIFPNMGPQESNRQSGQYSIFWRTGEITIEKLQNWAKEIVLMRSSGCNKEECAVPEPILVKALYVHYRAGKWRHKYLTWHLFGNDAANLDAYDNALQQIHDLFVEQEKTHISFVRYDIESFYDFMIHGDMNAEDKEKPQAIGELDIGELLFSFNVPYFPREFLKRVFQETGIIPDVTVSNEDIDAILTLAEQHLQEFYDRP